LECSHGAVLHVGREVLEVPLVELGALVDLDSGEVEVDFVGDSLLVDVVGAEFAALDRANALDGFDGQLVFEVGEDVGQLRHVEGGDDYGDDRQDETHHDSTLGLHAGQVLVAEDCVHGREEKLVDVVLPGCVLVLLVGFVLLHHAQADRSHDQQREHQQPHSRLEHPERELGQVAHLRVGEGLQLVVVHDGRLALVRAQPLSREPLLLRTDVDLVAGDPVVHNVLLLLYGQVAPSADLLHFGFGLVSDLCDHVRLVAGLDAIRRPREGDTLLPGFNHH